MSHMVIYRGVDGKPGYHQTDDIHDAVGFVEQMRNEEGVEHARIFRLEEVVFEYRPYYRVELTTSGGADAGNGALEDKSKVVGEVTAGSTNGSSGDGDAFELVDPDDGSSTSGNGTESSAAAGGKRGLFGR